MERDARQAVPMMVCLVLSVVVIPVEDYRALRALAYPPTKPPEPPPVDAVITRVEYDLRANGGSAAGEARVTVDGSKESCRWHGSCDASEGRTRDIQIAAEAVLRYAERER
jgi:hypothetical protein